MKTFLALQLLGAMMSVRAADISEVRATRVIGQVPAYSQYGRAFSLQAAEAFVQVPLADGSPAKGDLIVLFDPVTKHFLWRESTRGPKGPFDLVFIGGIPGSPWHGLYSSADSITWWQVPAMYAEIQTSTETAYDLGEAFDQALSELKAGWLQHYSKAEYPNWKKVDFTDKQLRSFLDSPAAPAAGLVPSIEDITRVDNGYRISLRGVWRGEIVIGDDMTVKERFHRVADK